MFVGIFNNARWFSCKVMATYERISIALLIPANVLYSLALFSHSWFQLPDVSYGLWVAKYCDYLSCKIIPAFFTEEPGKRSNEDRLMTAVFFCVHCRYMIIIIYDSNYLQSISFRFICKWYFFFEALI